MAVAGPFGSAGAAPFESAVVAGSSGTAVAAAPFESAVAAVPFGSAVAAVAVPFGAMPESMEAAAGFAVALPYRHSA